jgi:hypothetical protein
LKKDGLTLETITTGGKELCSATFNSVKKLRFARTHEGTIVSIKTDEAIAKILLGRMFFFLLF